MRIFAIQSAFHSVLNTAHEAVNGDFIKHVYIIPAMSQS